MDENQNVLELMSQTPLGELVRKNGELQPNSIALRFKDDTYSYRDLAELTKKVSSGLSRVGVKKGTVVAVLLPNRPEAIIGAFATFLAGGIFVPVNPLLRPRQLIHVLRDSSATILLTTHHLLAPLQASLQSISSLQSIVIIDQIPDHRIASDHSVYSWTELTDTDISKSQAFTKSSIDDPALIFYTSGSTGPAKGVLLSHRNLVDGARIVSGYLGNTGADRILATLPISFDYGFSQVTTALYVGAQVILTNFSLPQQFRTEIAKYSITGAAGVPTMWTQVSELTWGPDVASQLRYITNSGGRLSRPVLKRLRGKLPSTDIFLMYGLTESFRSTYLHPSLVDSRPDSIGMAIPEVDIHVINKKGERCKAGELGELVHSGTLVSLGYWRNPEATARRFRPLPIAIHGVRSEEMAVWSGDIVRKDKQGFLYFVERADNMIKSSGYRISPTEIEDTILETNLVSSVVAIGLPDETLGQRIGIAIVPHSAHGRSELAIRHACAVSLPPYMQPGEIVFIDEMPCSANGKPDRKRIREFFPNPSI